MCSESIQSATIEDYCAAVRRYTEAIERVLEAGRLLERRYDLFCRQNRLTSGIGAEHLTAPELDPVQRHTHTRLLELAERAYAALLAEQPRSPALPLTASVSSRALRSRNRI